MANARIVGRKQAGKRRKNMGKPQDSKKHQVLRHKEGAHPQEKDASKGADWRTVEWVSTAGKRLE